MSEAEILIRTTRRLLFLVSTALLFVIGFVLFHAGNGLRTHSEKASQGWFPPDSAEIADHEEGALIGYGRDLIAHTSRYLGPGGKVQPLSNGLNCQNCHLDAGTKIFAANYGAVASTYPKFRQRSGTVEGFEKRVNDCLERSLNGRRLDENSREMKAIVAYLKWVGKEVPRGSKPFGSGLITLPPLDRPADPVKGKRYYHQYCLGCHGAKGEGVKYDDGIEWKYPPLWGPDSYNTGAGLYRISKFAAFIKANMPYGVTYKTPLLTDEQAWDIAAYVNSMPRPHKEFPLDWPDLSAKPVDHPFGPYADPYSEKEHKYGPFNPIMSARKK